MDELMFADTSVPSETVSVPVAQVQGAGDVAISARNVGKLYRLYDRPEDRLKQALFWRLGRNYGRQFWALQDVSFEVRRGETLGIIGLNGSGKSTLLQIVAGIIPATTGEVRVQGRVASLLELGSGFNPEYTGRENVYVSGAILGFSREEMNARFDEIVDFAEIGQFIDQPVKYYSSGMFVRLAFAVYACLDPDVLIVDEALSVGDIFFQQKCHARMEAMLARQTAILMVSHNMETITKYSTRTLLLDQGRCLFLGGPEEAVNRYYNLTERSRRHAPLERTLGSGTTTHLGDSTLTEIPDWPVSTAFLDISQAVIIGAEEGVARCTGIALCNTHGQPCATFEMGEQACFYYEFELLQDIEMPTGGLAITNALNVMVHSKNTLNYQLIGPPVTPKGSRIRFRQTAEFALAPGEYTFGIALGTISPEGFARVVEAPYDSVGLHDVVILRVRQAGRFLLTRTRAPIPFHGYADLKGECHWAILPPAVGGEQ